MKKIYLAFCFLSMALYSYGQEKIKALVSERVFLAPTETYYDKNDTVEVVGQLLSTDYTDFYPYSRYLYLELADNKNQLIVRQKVKCAPNGHFCASIPLENYVENGVYYLRGYTQFMRNRNNAFYPMTPVFVGVRPATSEDSNHLKVMFFPEGGHLVAGVTQNVGLYLCDDKNQPVLSDFCVLKNATDTIVSGKTTLSGFASFGFMPQSGASYMLKTSQSEQTFLLPSLDSGRTIQAFIHKNRLICNVLESSQDTLKDGRVFIYHPSFGQKEMMVKNGTAIADLTGCTPGILTVCLTDEKRQIVSQRVLWVSHEENHVQVDLKTEYRQGEALSLHLQDTIPGSQVMVRIVPDWDTRSSHAFDKLTFSNELSAPVPFPQKYYEEDATEARRDIAAWLLSASQTMLGKDFLQKDSVAYPYPIEAGMNIAGTISQDNRPVTDANVQLFNTRTHDAAMATTDANGHFAMAVNDYQDGTRFYVQAYNKKGKPDNFLYKLDEYEFPPIVNISAYHTFAREAGEQDLAAYRTRLDSAKTYNLDEVVVTRRAINQKRYNWARTRNAFNFYDHNFLTKHHNFYTLKDIVLYTGKVMISNENNILWKNLKYSGLMGMASGGGSNQNHSLNNVHLTTKAAQEVRREGSSEEKSQILLVLDGFRIERDLSDILSMPTTDLESVELVMPTDPRSYWYSASFGFFDVKTRTVMNKEEISSNGITVRPMGISIPRNEYECKLPSAEGKYKVLIDIVSPDRQVLSIVRNIEVKK